jgi:hypothetical protein
MGRWEQKYLPRCIIMLVTTKENKEGDEMSLPEENAHTFAHQMQS